jgi:hypothetical protein
MESSPRIVKFNINRNTQVNPWGLCLIAKIYLFEQLNVHGFYSKVTLSTISFKSLDFRTEY